MYQHKRGRAPDILLEANGIKLSVRGWAEYLIPADTADRSAKVDREVLKIRGRIFQRRNGRPLNDAQIIYGARYDALNVELGKGLDSLVRSWVLAAIENQLPVIVEQLSRNIVLFVGDELLRSYQSISEFPRHNMSKEEFLGRVSPILKGALEIPETPQTDHRSVEDLVMEQRHKDAIPLFFQEHRIADDYTLFKDENGNLMRKSEAILETLRIFPHESIEYAYNKLLSDSEYVIRNQIDMTPVPDREPKVVPMKLNTKAYDIARKPDWWTTNWLPFYALGDSPLPDDHDLRLLNREAFTNPEYLRHVFNPADALPNAESWWCLDHYPVLSEQAELDTHSKHVLQHFLHHIPTRAWMGIVDHDSFNHAWMCYQIAKLLTNPAQVLADEEKSRFILTFLESHAYNLFDLMGLMVGGMNPIEGALAVSAATAEGSQARSQAAAFLLGAPVEWWPAGAYSFFTDGKFNFEEYQYYHRMGSYESDSFRFKALDDRYDFDEDERWPYYDVLAACCMYGRNTFHWPESAIEAMREAGEIPFLPCELTHCISDSPDFSIR